MYGAWAYKVDAVISGRHTWNIGIERATYTSANLLLTTNYQNVYVRTTLVGSSIASSSPTFTIKRTSLWTLLNKLYSPNVHSIEGASRYVLISKTPGHRMVVEVLNLLRRLLLEKEVFAVHYSKGVMKIELSTRCLEEEILLSIIKANF